MDTLVDEFDPIRSLDAFGMHVIEDNPGVKEALSAREHSIAIRLNEKNASKHDAEGTDVNDAAAAAQSVQKASSDGAGDVAEACAEGRGRRGTCATKRA